MKLTFTEKVMLSQVLPTEGNFETLVIIKDIQKKSEITQEQLKKHNVEQTDSGITWKDPEVEYDIDFTESEKIKIKSVLKKLSEDEKLNFQLLSLYEKFN